MRECTPRLISWQYKSCLKLKDINERRSGLAKTHERLHLCLLCYHSATTVRRIFGPQLSYDSLWLNTALHSLPVSGPMEWILCIRWSGLVPAQGYPLLSITYWWHQPEPVTWARSSSLSAALACQKAITHQKPECMSSFVAAVRAPALL